MNNDIFKAIKGNRKIIFSLTSIYSFILIFPAFGPVLNKLIGILDATMISSLFLICLVIGFVISPLKIEKKYNCLPLLLVLSIILSILFVYMNIYLKIISVLVFGISCGRYSVCWCFYFYNKILNTNHKFSHAKIIGYILFLSYFLLYISNILVPFMSKQLTAFWPVIFLLFALVNCKEISFKNQKYLQVKRTETFSLPKKTVVIIFLVFITAGTTYAGIYPNLNVTYEQYYNVLPFLLAAFMSGYISDKKGRKILLFFGVGFLGLSFIFTFISNVVISYFLMQTFLQIGWAFNDAYAWITGTDYSIKNKNPMVIAYFVAVFLSGTFFGSIINNLYREQVTAPGVFNSLLTYFPLFIAMFFIAFIPETLYINKRVEAEKEFKDIFSCLTSRELEIAKYLITDMTNDEISRLLYISPNTLKTHARNIYKKVNVKNKRELRKISDNIKP